MSILVNATNALDAQLFKVVNEITQKDISENISYSMCNWNLTAIECPQVYFALNSGEIILINAFNPSTSRSVPMRVKIPRVNFTIFNANNQPILGDIICSNQTDPKDCELYLNVNQSQ